MQEKQSVQRQGQAFQLSDAGDKAAFLARHVLFQHLDAHVLQDVERLSTLTAYSPGRILYRPGESGTALFLVMSGEVQLYHLSTDGRKLITNTLTSGAFFGALPMLDSHIHTSFAEVMTHTRLCVMNRHDIEQLLHQQPSVALAMLKVMSQRCAEFEAQLINTTFKSTTARLATLLLQLAHSSNRIEGMSHEALAEHLGVYRETVSVALRELKESGALELGRKYVTIQNRATLEAFTA